MSEHEESGETQDQFFQQRLRKLEWLRAQGIDPFVVERWERSLTAAQATDEALFATQENQTVSMAGRMVAKRLMGKSAFANVTDESGRVQLFISVNSIGAEAYERFKETTDLGDFLGVKGHIFRTKTGEISIHVQEVEMISKALRPPPMGKIDADGQTHNALSDVEDRYRYRYLDLIANPESRKTLTQRSRIVSSMRRFLDGKGFLEVETPVLQQEAGGAAARPFQTHHNYLDRDFKLRISLELFLKRLIVGGFEKVYEIGRVFRNENMDRDHNPEFTLMELYQAYVNLEDIMELVEEMYEAICIEVNGTPTFAWNGQTIDLSARPWRRLPMLEGIQQYSGIDPADLRSLETAHAACRAIDAPIDLSKEPTLGGLIEKLHEVYTQPQLVQPTFITDFPTETSPLAKKKPDDPSLTRRFEVYIGMAELGNAFSEINDPLDQRERFLDQVAQRAAGDAEAHPMDEDFLRALEYGMPPTGGLGIGIDRMVMLLTGAESIRDVLLFPLMKPR